MHEMGIATSVLDAAQNEAKRHPGSKLLKVGLRIGEWSGVDPDSLRFCFEALVLGSENAPALDIEFRPRQNRCRRPGLALESFSKDKSDSYFTTRCFSLGDCRIGHLLCVVQALP